MPDLKHSIKVVSNRTGLSQHVIRAWERRYGVVSPARTEGNQRLYTAGDIERLLLLHRGTSLGHNIGRLAELPTDRLRQLLADETGRMGSAPVFENVEAPVVTHPSEQQPNGAKSVSEFLREAFAAVTRMDAVALEQTLEQAVLDLGGMRLLQEVIQPLVVGIGEKWSAGELRVSHEHVGTAIIRTFLARTSRPIALHPNAPVLVCTTPAGQLHELGSLLVASVAASQGWKIVYAGPSLPAEEIASMSIKLEARAVALSIVFPPDDPTLGAELTQLRRLLPESMAIFVGGRSASAYRGILESIGATLCGDLADFSENLARLRSAGTRV